MGAIGGFLGTAGGAGGTGFAAPKSAPIINPTTPEGVSASTAGVTSAQGSTDDLLKALLSRLPPDTQAKILAGGSDRQQALDSLGGPGMQKDAGASQSTLTNGLTNLGGPTTMGQATSAQGTLVSDTGAIGAPGAIKDAITGQTVLNKDIGAINGAGVVGDAVKQQGVLNQDLGGANGVGIQTGAVAGLGDVLSQQRATAAQLQNIANGTGPNPAQAMLNQATGQNVANQAALMAGQRGASSNVGLIARQAAQQGAGIQQNAVGQGATLQANQSLNALNALGGQQQAMGGTNTSIANVGAGITGQEQTGIRTLADTGLNTIGAQQTGTTALGNQGVAGTGVTQAANNSLYNMGSTTTGQTQGAISQQAGQGQAIVGEAQRQQDLNQGIVRDNTGAIISVNGQAINGALTNQGQQFGAVQGVNNAQVGMRSNINTGNVGLATGKMTQQTGAIGGALNALGGAGGLMGGGGGGGAGAGGGPGAGAAQPTDTETSMDTGGENESDNTPPSQDGSFTSGDPNTQYAASGGMALTNPPAARSSFGQFLTSRMAGGGAVHDYRGGGGVKAASSDQKAVKSGNSYANDKIPAMLSEGEVVIPRSVLQSKDPARGAADFVAKVMAKRGKK